MVVYIFACFIEMLPGLPINISTAFLIFISEWGILSIEM